MNNDSRRIARRPRERHEMLTIRRADWLRAATAIALLYVLAVTIVWGLHLHDCSGHHACPFAHGLSTSLWPIELELNEGFSLVCELPSSSPATAQESGYHARAPPSS